MKLMDFIEKSHSKAMCAKVVHWVSKNPQRFGQLVSLVLIGTTEAQQRAAWPMSYCVEAHPELAKPHLQSLVKNLRHANLPDAVIRNTVRLLQYTSIPKALQGEVTDHCFRYVADPKAPTAVRAFSIGVLSNLVKELPELAGELSIILEDQLPYGSPGFASRARKLLRQLQSSSNMKAGKP